MASSSRRFSSARIYLSNSQHTSGRPIRHTLNGHQQYYESYWKQMTGSSIRQGRSLTTSATTRTLSLKRCHHANTRLRRRSPPVATTTLTRIGASAKAKRGKATLSSPSSSQSFTQQTATATQQSEKQWIERLTAYLQQQRTIPIPRWVTPGHQTISISEIFGHSSFVLVAISYAVDDFLMLRCIAVVGSTAMLVFTYFHPHGRVLWLPFKWNALFIALNCYRIGKVFLDRHFAENLGREYIQLRDEHFHLMDPVDFAKIIRLGKVETYQAGEEIVAQGEENRFVRLVIDGELEVLRDGKITYMIEEASFVSESGLHAGIMLPGSVNSCCSVKAQTNSRVLAWDRTELLHLMELDSNVHRSLQNAMSWDIVRKLKTQRTLLSSGRIDDPEKWNERRQEQSIHRYTAILQNLLQHNRLLNAGGRDNLHNYRVIHHIDDEYHLLALKECGWTPEEFEMGKRPGWHGDDDDQHNKHEELEERKDWRWYLRAMYLRFIG
uniref:Cyclic nucleotide-binding domain-containing protein n=1 Tax=Entomoneis paludosa TaxID=265537 RepID=A0A7S2YNR7_9STRA